MGIKNLFDISDKELKKLEKEYLKVENLAESMEKLSDDELKNKTNYFKEQLSKGKTLDDIKYEAIAVCREASRRVLGMYPFKVQVIGALNLNEGNISEMKTGEGKAIDVNTKVPTPNGWVKAGDIKVGDYLFDRLGNPTKVTGVYNQGKINTLEVVLKDGRKIRCNDEHLWSVYPDYSRKNLKTLTTKEMLSGGIRKNRGYKYHLPLNSAVEYSTQNLKIPPYVMGNFLGNGCKNDAKIFCLSTGDLETVEYISKLLDVIPYKQSNNSYSWVFHKKENIGNKKSRLKISDIDSKYEELLSQTLSGDKYIPDEYKLSSITQRWELIQGLMDSDGNIHKELEGKRYNLSFSTTSKKLRDDFIEIIYSLGLSATWRLGKTPEKDGVKNEQYVIRINVPHDIKPKFFKLSRKKNIAIEASTKNPRKRDYKKIAIVEINNLNEKSEQVCFTVDNPEHLFLVGDYVVTHNTLTATMAVYLNALEGNGVHVVTVNEYLSERDGVELGELYNWLGLSVGINKQKMTPKEKREAYACDITYTTNSELGFDYLRDNMVYNKKDKVQRPLNYCIIDEVDSVLIDEARTPLIISNTGQESPMIYKRVDSLVKQLNRETDLKFDVEHKLVDLTDSGIDKLEKLTGLENLFSPENHKLYHHIYMALRANFVIEKDTDYVIKDGSVMLVDTFTGRIMQGRRYSDGLHQALEAKENVAINPENKTMASITYQNYFRLYKKLSGMTGTAKTEEEEFREIYNMLVVSIPTNKPVIREDRDDLIFPSMKLKFDAVVNDIKYLHQKEQPILIGTSSVYYSEYLSNLLTQQNIPHEVLNAKNHKKEAEIILNAGQKGAITIATNMAGRGTDIKLGLGVKELGGLAVLGTERYESRRIDNQLRGRSGRQGDVGFSQFYVSLEDDLPKRFGSDKLKNILSTLLSTSNVKSGNNDMALRSKFLSKQIESAQKRVEGNNYDSRKNVLVYDDVLAEQREIIYKERDCILNKPDNLVELCIKSLDDFYQTNKEDFINVFKNNVDNFDDTTNALDEIKLIIKNKFDNQDNLEILKNIMISSLDEFWIEHIDEMNQLKDSITLRSYAQKDPKVAYQEEGFKMYNDMLIEAKKELIKSILKNK